MLPAASKSSTSGRLWGLLAQRSTKGQPSTAPIQDGRAKAGKFAGSPKTLDCLLIADDLTGACDAAVHFARRGRRTSVSLSPLDEASSADVLTVSSDTRDLEPAAAATVVTELFSALAHFRPAILFKKIDSTLRGNISHEIAGALDMFGCDAAVVCPAFPALHRIVEQGWLRIRHAQEFQPIDVAGCLREPRLESCLAVRPAGIGLAISGGARVVLADAATDGDLDQIVMATQSLNRRILWVGSGGLASALARNLPGRAADWTSTPAPRGPIAFCIGSDHAITAAQLAELQNCRSVLMASVTADRSDLVAALRAGKHVCIRVPRDTGCTEKLRELIGGLPAAALLLSGGHTASFVCQAAGAREIELYDEILPGVPRGVLRGGDCDGMAIATKSGAFGGPDALIRIADFFS